MLVSRPFIARTPQCPLLDSLIHLFDSHRLFCPPREDAFDGGGRQLGQERNGPVGMKEYPDSIARPDLQMLAGHFGIDI